MKGPKVLDAVQFPTISFQSSRVNVGPSQSYTVVGALKLHGTARRSQFRWSSRGESIKGQ